MSDITVRKAFNKLNHSTLFYIPFILIYLNYSKTNNSLLEMSFYFIFYFDKNYKEVTNGLTINSKFFNKIRGCLYFRTRNKNNFLDIYNQHFLKLLSLCLSKNLIIMEDGNLNLSTKGILMAKTYEKKFNQYPSNSTINILMKNVKNLAVIKSDFKFIDVLEKLGVISL